MKNLMFLLVLAGSCCLGAVEKAVVYVVKFEPNGECKASAGELQILWDRVLGNVVSSRKYEVVERENLAKVQEEFKWVDGGLTEGKAPESNRLKAAGYCIYGKVIQYRSFLQSVSLDGGVTCANGLVEIQIRIANIQTGRILAAKTVKVEKKKAVTNAAASTQNLEQAVMADATEDAAKRVVEKLNDVAFPVYVLSANSRHVTANVTEELVTVGDVWEVIVLGDELKDPQTGEHLGFDEEQIACVRVSRPGAKVTKFEYGADDESADKAKKDIFAAREDGEKLIMRKMPQVSEASRKPSIRDLL